MTPWTWKSREQEASVHRREDRGAREARRARRSHSPLERLPHPLDRALRLAEHELRLEPKHAPPEPRELAVAAGIGGGAPRVTRAIGFDGQLRSSHREVDHARLRRRGRDRRGARRSAMSSSPKTSLTFHRTDAPGATRAPPGHSPDAAPGKTERHRNAIAAIAASLRSAPAHRSREPRSFTVPALPALSAALR